VALVLPTGYAFNHDGTCLYFASVSVFLAQAVGIPLSIGQQLGLLAILATYVVVLPYAGYVVATAVLIGAVARFSGAPFGRDLLLVAIAGGVVLWLLFDPMLDISLPFGSWWQGR